MLPTINTSQKFCDFAELYLRSFSTNHSQTWQFYYFLALFSAVSTQIFTNSSLVKSWKNCGRIYSPVQCIWKIEPQLEQSWWSWENEIALIVSYIFRDKMPHVLQKVYKGLYEKKDIKLGWRVLVENLTYKYPPFTPLTYSHIYVKDNIIAFT